MRAVLVILVLGLSAWGIYAFLQSPQVEGKEDEQGPAIPFLTREEGAAGPDSAAVPLDGAGGRATPGPGPEPTPLVQDSEGEIEDRGTSPESVFGVSLKDAPSAGGQDRGLARALLFGDPAAVERALSQVDVEDAERRFYLAFAEALSGNRRGGLELAKGLDDPDALGSLDRGLLQAALTGQGGAQARPASSTTEPLVRRAMRLKLLEREGGRWLETGDHAAAARAYSDLLLAALRGPWEPERLSLLAWSDGLGRAQARHRWDPRGVWPSVEMEVQGNDSLTAIRKRYLAEHPDGLLCTGMVERANQIVGFIHPGDTLRIPTDRAWALVDLSSRWMLYLLGDEVAAAWEVGIGREGEETIIGVFRAADKQEEPTWFRRGQEPQYYPDNPLGTRWIAWYRDGQKSGFGFHGTWEPETVGTAASDGCIRLRNEEVQVLFKILPVGAEIHVQN